MLHSIDHRHHDFKQGNRTAHGGKEWLKKRNLLELVTRQNTNLVSLPSCTDTLLHLLQIHEN